MLSSLAINMPHHLHCFIDEYIPDPRIYQWGLMGWVEWADELK
jgi:hypothetical protein